MLIVIGTMALVGAVVTAIVLWPLGVLIALAAAPFGGSLLVLVVAVAMWVSQAAEPRSGQTQSQSRSRPPIKRALKHLHLPF